MNYGLCIEISRTKAIRQRSALTVVAVRRGLTQHGVCVRMRACGLDGADSAQLAPHGFVVSREHEWTGAVQRVTRGRGNQFGRAIWEVRKGAFVLIVRCRADSHVMLC